MTVYNVSIYFQCIYGAWQLENIYFENRKTESNIAFWIKSTSVVM